MPAPLLSASGAIGEFADQAGIRDTLQWFTREKQWVNDIHLQLCRIPSPTFLEQQRAEWMLSQFRALGWHAAIDREGNVLAALDRTPEGPLVAVTAHLDTVLAPRGKEEITVGPAGDLRGPGVSDNGAGLAALLAIARAIRMSDDPDLRGDLWRRLLLVANTGEEGEGNLRGMRYLCSQQDLASRIQAFVVLDGAVIDHITTQAIGSRRFEVTFNGPGGHSWSDFGIGNPVHALSRTLACFVDDNPLDPRATPRTAINCGIIEGGSGINVIPASARAKLDIRSEDPARIAALSAALDAAAMHAEELENARASASGKVSARVKEIGNRPAGRLAENSNLLTTLRSVDRHLGIRSKIDAASTDANIPLSMGIPAVSIGAGGTGGGAHTTAEWYQPKGRDLGLKRVLLTTALMLRSTQS